MDTALVVVVFLVVLVLFGGVGYFFLKETGVENARLWFTAARHSGRLPGARRARSAAAIDAETADDAGLGIERHSGSRPALSERPMPLQMDDDALRELREELQGELRRASGITREFDARLTRIEANSVDTPRIAEELERSLRTHAEAQRREIEHVRTDMETVRQDMGPRGERRHEALSDLYGHLARVESALAAIVNPMLLPGEPLALPAELHPDTLVWDNWSDVGERAYAFGDAFNQSRLVLDSTTADEIEWFIATLRQGLTGAIYPNVRTEKPSSPQVAQMRAGLESIVASLPGVRRRVEVVYRGETSANSMPETGEESNTDSSGEGRAH